MSSIPGGIPLSGFVSPTDSTDTFPTHDSQYGKGGWREVANITERDAISTDRRREGMAVHVVDDAAIYRLVGGITNSDWQIFGGSVVTLTVLGFQALGGVYRNNTVYKIIDADSTLYGGTEIYLQTDYTGTLDIRGIGKFWTPKYDIYPIWNGYSRISSFSMITGRFNPGVTVTNTAGGTGTIVGGIESLCIILHNEGLNWDLNPTVISYSGNQANITLASILTYNSGDKVIWGGKLWENDNGLVGTDELNHGNNVSMNLDNNWNLIPFNETDYNHSYDRIEYDVINDKIVYRNDNFNEIQANSESILSSISDTNYAPIVMFQWGNHVKVNGIKIENSYFYNINSDGTYQTNIEIKNNSKCKLLTFIDWNGSFNGTYISDIELNASNFSIQMLRSYIKNIRINNSVFFNNVLVDSYLENIYLNDSTELSAFTIKNNSYIKDTVMNNSSIRSTIVDNSSYIWLSSFQDSSFYNNVMNNNSHVVQCYLRDGSSFQNCNLVLSYFSGISMNLSSINFMILDTSNITSAILSKSFIQTSTLINSNIIDVHLSGASLIDASTLDSSSITSTYLSNNSSLSNLNMINNSSITQCNANGMSSIGNVTDVLYLDSTDINTIFLENGSALTNGTIQNSTVSNLIIKDDSVLDFVTNTYSGVTIENNTYENYITPIVWSTNESSRKYRGDSETTTTLDAIHVKEGGRLKEISASSLSTLLNTYAQVNITTNSNITTNTLSDNSLSQHGRNNLIINSLNINIECETTSQSNFIATYQKEGSGNITFTAGAGITLRLVDGTATLNGALGSTATLSRVSSTVYAIRISNA